MTFRSLKGHGGKAALIWHLVPAIAKLEKDSDEWHRGAAPAALGDPMKMANLDRLKRMLADDLKTLREGKGVLGVEEMADAIEMVGPEYSINARGIRAARHDASTLATEYAVVLTKLDRPT